MTKQLKEHFSVDSALLSELGEKLVTTPHVALAELVKNSYDADATKVYVTIVEDEHGMPTIEVKDNGHGMTLQGIRMYWMRIGTTNKAKDQYSPVYGRTRTGEKGIGRFACRRLGSALKVDTCAKFDAKDIPESGDRYQKTALQFDWKDFTPGTDVAGIDVTRLSSTQASGPTGLRLFISGVERNEWSFRGFAYLKRQLASLCANQGCKREGYKEDPGFKVYVSAPALQEQGAVTDLREQLMNAGWGTLSAEVDEEGHLSATLVAKTIGKRSVKSSQAFPNLKAVKLRLAIFPIEREWLRDTSVVSKTSVNELCESWGGVQLRYKGFRVYPYGDDDWLNIEKDRARRLGKPSDSQIFDYARTLEGVKASRSLLNMLSMKNYFGSVDVDEKQTGLEVKADRMGFIETPVFREIQEFARFAIDWAMVIRDYAVQSEEAKKQDELRKKLETEHGEKLSADSPSEDAIKIIRRTIQHVASQLPSNQQKSMSLLRDATSYLETSLNVATRDLTRLRLVASASTLTLLFAHEIKSLAGTFSSIAKEIKSLAKVSSGAVAKRLNLLGEDVETSQENLKELLELTNSMGVLNRNAQPVHIEIKSAVERAIARFKRVTQRYGIDIEGAEAMPEGLQIGPMLEGEILAVLINVLSNSIKSVIAGGSKRLIELKAHKNGKHVTLDVFDTGVGLDPHYFEDAFTPMISDPSGTLYDRLESRLNPEDGMLLGSGTGLGLSIVRGILRARNGDVSFVSPSLGWNAHLQIDFP